MRARYDALSACQIVREILSRCQQNCSMRKGAVRAWPETYAKVDAKLLWNRKHLDLNTADLGATNSQLTESRLGVIRDESLRWSFSWGDDVVSSYFWEDARTSRGININGYSNHVTANLEAALRQLRDSYCTKQSFKLWADAICIDQRNHKERGQLVGR